MVQTVSVLPFFFRHVEALDRYLLTNQAGAFAFLDNKDFLARLVGGDVSHLPAETLDDLTSKNFATADNDVAERAFLLGSRYASLIGAAVVPPSLFMVVPTLRCDHDCGYCQVSRVTVTRSGYDLDLEKIEKIVRIIDSVAGNRPKIEFQGGEPLLAFPFVRQFVDVAESRLGPKSPSFVICSAFGRLPDEMLEWAKHHDVVFSVSLDGPESLHNRNRPSSYFQPYQRVIENIQRVRNATSAEKVNCLATITRESLDQADQIVDTYFELGLESVFLRPLSPFGFASPRPEGRSYSASEFFEFFKAALDRVIDLNRKRHFVEETALVHLRKIFRPGEATYVDLKSPAGHLFGALLFNYDGRIFGSDEARMLWETTKVPELVLGTVDDEPTSIFNNRYAVSMLSDTFTGTMPGCDDCAYQIYCGADPLYHLATQGDHVGNKSLSFFCQLERKILDHLFVLHSTSPVAQSVFDRWLMS